MPAGSYSVNINCNAFRKPLQVLPIFQDLKNGPKMWRKIKKMQKTKKTLVEKRAPRYNVFLRKPIPANHIFIHIFRKHFLKSP